VSAMTSYWGVMGSRPINVGECAVGRRLAFSLNLCVGQSISIEDPPGYRGRLKVTGIIDSGDEDEDRIFVPMGENSGESAPAGAIYALLSVPGGEAGISRLAADLRGYDVVVRPLRKILHGEEITLSKVKLLAALCLVAVLVLSSMGVSAGMLARVIERRQEIALLQTLGAGRRWIVLFLLSESAALGVVGTAMGFLLGTLMSRLVTRIVFQVSVSPHWISFLAALGVTVGVSVLAGAAGVRRAFRIEPARALREE